MMLSNATILVEYHKIKVVICNTSVVVIFQFLTIITFFYNEFYCYAA